MKTSNYADLVHQVITNGREIDSRYGATKELVSSGLVLPAGTIPHRKRMNYGIGWIEFLHLLAGVYRPDDMARVAPKADLDLFTYSMAYGPRITKQLPIILNAIKREERRRQIVMFVGKPEDGPTSHQPCTTSMQFLVYKGFLDVVVSMRSWDLLKGAPYDMFMFGGIAMVVAELSGLMARFVYVTAGSCHIYKADFESGMLPTGQDAMFGIDKNLFKDGLKGVTEWADAQATLLQPREVPRGILVVKGSELNA